MFRSMVSAILFAIAAASTSALYSDEPPRQEPVTLTAVPYYTWGNRGLNQMLVWIPE